MTTPHRWQGIQGFPPSFLCTNHLWKKSVRHRRCWTPKLRIVARRSAVSQSGFSPFEPGDTCCWLYLLNWDDVWKNHYFEISLDQILVICNCFSRLVGHPKKSIKNPFNLSYTWVRVTKLHMGVLMLQWAPSVIATVDTDSIHITWRMTSA